jgi:hypothetical protein
MLGASDLASELEREPEHTSRDAQLELDQAQ